jgi:hypothetical protein
MWDHNSEHSRQYPSQKRFELLLAPALQPALKESPMYILQALAFLLFLAQVVLAEQPTPILCPQPLRPMRYGLSSLTGEQSEIRSQGSRSQLHALKRLRALRNCRRAIDDEPFEEA